MAQDDIEWKPGRLRRINIPSPNPALADWLMGTECRGVVQEVTEKIFVTYQNTLPVITGNLRRGAYMRVDHGGFGAEQDRWFGWVGNNALSYRKQRNQPYPRYIEYGKPTKGVPGQYQLRRAAELVAGGLGTAEGINIPGVTRDSRLKGSGLRGARGRIVANPLVQDKK